MCANDPKPAYLVFVNEAAVAPELREDPLFQCLAVF